ncbi:hypothetical protein V6N11_083759 [Hibiscus sabdariffa]|uniref:Uncharacterized protein n=1 Tax=Hibiscus sabdariffa TaxID=183260 RepID=A0ABR2QCH9_9ROSI
MKSQEQARFLLGFRFLIDLNGSSFSFALPGSSLVTLSMAFVRNMYTTGYNSAVAGTSHLSKDFVYLFLIYLQGFTPKKIDSLGFEELYSVFLFYF